jgi:hypothetical protein
MHNTSSKPQKEEIPTNQTTPQTPRRKIRITKEIDLLVAQPQRERERGMDCEKKKEREMKSKKKKRKYICLINM